MLKSTMLHRLEKDGLTWIDLEAPTGDEVQRIADEFGLDPRITNELLSPTPRPRAERYGNQLYLILHFPVWKHTHFLSPHQEIDFVLGKRFLITAHYETVDALHKFGKEFEVETILRHEDELDMGVVFSAALIQLYKNVEHELAFLHEKLKDVEKRMFLGEEREMVMELSHLGRECLSFKRALSLHDEILKGFQVTAKEVCDDTFERSLFGVFQEYLRVSDALLARIEEVNELRETNNALLSTKQNDVMKKLTVLTFIGLPSTLVLALFGMNVASAPLLGQPNDFWYIAGLAGSCSLILFLIVRLYRWL